MGRRGAVLPWGCQASRLLGRGGAEPDACPAVPAVCRDELSVGDSGEKRAAGSREPGRQGCSD